MGHRALVAYERADDRYDLHYSHWGGADLRLADEITPEAPYGGPAPRAGDPCGPRPGTAVDPDPLVTGVAFGEAVGRLDFLLHEAFYVVGADFAVRAYLVLPFGIPTGEGVIEDPSVGRGALVAADGSGEYLRGWFDGAKAVVGELVDAGSLPGRAAVSLLADELRRFVGDDRELILDPARGEQGD